MLELVHAMRVPKPYFENQIHMKSVEVALRQLGPVVDAMGPLTLARAAEEHAGPHDAWFWDPQQQGGGVLSDMGCHSIALSWYALTPPGRAPDFLVPESVQAEVGLLKWGQPRFRLELESRFGIDYEATPAEDFATGIVTYRNPESGQRVKGQFTVSWMYDKQGLRLLFDALGPGYALDANSLRSPLEKNWLACTTRTPPRCTPLCSTSPARRRTLATSSRTCSSNSRAVPTRSGLCATNAHSSFGLPTTSSSISPAAGPRARGVSTPSWLSNHRSSPWAMTLMRTFRAALSAALGELPADQRAVVHLRLWESLTFEAIAETLGIPPNTAASRYRYGLDKLRQRLRPLYDEMSAS